MGCFLGYTISTLEPPTPHPLTRPRSSVNSTSLVNDTFPGEERGWRAVSNRRATIAGKMQKELENSAEAGNQNERSTGGKQNPPHEFGEP